VRSCTATTGSGTPSSIRPSRGVAAVSTGALDARPPARRPRVQLPALSFHARVEGLADKNLAELDLPTEQEYVAAYCRRAGARADSRVGVLPCLRDVPARGDRAGNHGRVVTGTANDPNARERGARARPLAESAWALVARQAVDRAPSRFFTVFLAAAIFLLDGVTPGEDPVGLSVPVPGVVEVAFERMHDAVQPRASADCSF